MLKTFLALEVKKIGFSIALIFGICIKFLDLLFLDKFTIVLLTLLLLLPLTTLLSLSLNIFKANSLDNLDIFNKKTSGAAILLKL